MAQKEIVSQGFATPDEAAAEAVRREADAAKPKVIAPTVAVLWSALKSKGLLTDDDVT